MIDAKNYFKERIAYLFSVFLLGIVVYLPMITHNLTNADGIWNSEHFKASYVWENALGRFGLRFVGKLIGNYTNASFSVPISILLIILSVSLICFLFEIKNKVSFVLVLLISLFSLSFVSTISYHYCSIAYFSAFLLSVICILLIKYDSKVNILLSIISLIILLSLYQAYIGVSVVLGLFYVLKMILKQEKDVMKFVYKGLAFGVVGVGLYLIISKNSNLLFNVSIDSGRGFADMGKISLSSLPSLIKNAYDNSFNFYFNDVFVSNSWYFRGFINIVVVLLNLILSAFIFVKKEIYKDYKLSVLFVLIILVLPISLSLMVVVAPLAFDTSTTGILMVPQMFLTYVFLFVLIDTYDFNKVINIFSKVVLGVIVFTQILYASIFQNYLMNCFNETYTMANMILNKIDYTPDMKIVIQGKPESFYTSESLEHHRYILKGTPVSYGIFWHDYNGQENGWVKFYENYMSIKFSVVYMDEFEALSKEVNYDKMPSFPSEGSIVKVKDVVIVKLGENYK